MTPNPPPDPATRSFRDRVSGLLNNIGPAPAGAAAPPPVPVDDPTVEIPTVPPVVPVVPGPPARPSLRPDPRHRSRRGPWDSSPVGGDAPHIILPGHGRIPLTVDASPAAVADAVDRVRAEGRPLHVAAPPAVWFDLFGWRVYRPRRLR
jgi:hypothetical protein